MKATKKQDEWASHKCQPLPRSWNPQKRLPAEATHDYEKTQSKWDSNADYARKPLATHRMPRTTTTARMHAKAMGNKIHHIMERVRVEADTRTALADWWPWVGQQTRSSLLGREPRK